MSRKPLKYRSREEQQAAFANMEKTNWFTGVNEDSPVEDYHPRKTAKDFGDNPDIRHSHGEHTQKSDVESWEQSHKRKIHHKRKQHRRIKKKLKKTPVKKEKAKPEAIKDSMEFTASDGSKVTILDGEHMIYQGRKVRLDKYGFMHPVSDKKEHKLEVKQKK